MIHRTRLNIHPERWGKGYSKVNIGEEGDVVGIKESSFGFWRILKFVFYPGQKALNFRAAIWHALLALFLIITRFITDPPFQLAFNRMWTTQNPDTIPPAFQTTICNGEDYVDADVMDWFACIRENVTAYRENLKDETDVPVYVPSVSEGWGKIEVFWLVLIFSVITSFCHWWLYKHDDDYQDRLNNQQQFLRWGEYSVTASIMLLCTVSLSRVQDQFLLVSLFLNSFSLNWFGALFEVCYYAERKTTDDIPLQLVLKRVKWFTFWMSWLFYAVNLWTIWDAFNSVIKPYFDLPTEPLWRQLFNIAEYANIGITSTFTLFPLIHFYQFARTMFKSWNRDSEPNTYVNQVAAYKRGETAYIWASFISKTVLVAVFGFVSFSRDDD